MMTLDEKFKAAVNVIRSLPKHGSYQPSTAMQLKFYSFYKQATEGPCTSPKPSFWDVVGKAKWDAWKNLGTMGTDEAMEKYVEELKQIIETMSYTENVAKFIDMLGPFYEVVPLDKASYNGDIENEGDPKGELPAIKNGRRINGYGQGDEVDSDGDEFSDTYDQVSEENGLSNGQATNSPSHLLNNPSDIWAFYPGSETDEMITQARGGAGTDLGTGVNPRGTNSTAGSRSVRQRPIRDAAGASAVDNSASNPGVSGGAGGGREGRGSSRTEDTTVEEQLALAVIKLQHTVDQVNTRLATLESSIKTFSSDKNKVKGIEFWIGISPRLLILILAWPFVAQWLLHICRRKK